MAEVRSNGVLGQRRSHSADTAWNDEVARIVAMTVRERVELALQLGLELDELFPPSGAHDDAGQ